MSIEFEHMSASGGSAASDSGPDKRWALGADSRRRVWLLMFASWIGGCAVSAILAPLDFTAGFVVGGGLALFNHRWLSQSLEALLASEDPGPLSAVFKLILRWIVIGLVGYAVYLTGLVKGSGIIAGLLIPAPAILFEAAFVACGEMFRRGE